MATAKKLPSGAYRCLIYEKTIDGKRKYKSFTASTKKEAELLASEYLNGKSIDTINEKKAALSYGKALSDYISLKEPVLSPSTIRGYKNIEKCLNRDFKNAMDTNLYVVDSNLVQYIINILSKTKSPKTVRNYSSLLYEVLNKFNPDNKVHATLPKSEQPDLYIPSDEEIKKLLEYAAGTSMEIPIYLGAFGMMRRGEICALSIEDLNGNIIHVHHSLVKGADGKYHIKAPKTFSSDRYVEIPQFVADKIMDKGYICNVKPHTLTVMLQKIIKKAGLPHFRFHDLRHYSASIRHALNIPDAYIMADGGWKTDYVLKSVYRHAMSERRKEMTSIANSHFNELCNTKCNTVDKK